MFIRWSVIARDGSKEPPLAKSISVLPIEAWKPSRLGVGEEERKALGASIWHEGPRTSLFCFNVLHLKA